MGRLAVNPQSRWFQEIAKHIAEHERAEFESWLAGQGEHVLRSANQHLWHAEARSYHSATAPRAMVTIGSAPGMDRPRRWTRWNSHPRKKLPRDVATNPVWAILAAGCPEWVLAAFALDTDGPTYVRMLTAAHTRDRGLLARLVGDCSRSAARVASVVVENPACPSDVALRAISLHSDNRNVLAAAAASPHLPEEARVMAALLSQAE